MAAPQAGKQRGQHQRIPEQQSVRNENPARMDRFVTSSRKQALQHAARHDFQP
jgi:hypothetical protein